MPAARALIWSLEQDTYAWYQGKEILCGPFTEKETTWTDLLCDRSSFAFIGRNGHLTLRKEARERGGGYWYAYRTSQKRTRKKYAGRDQALTFSRLETLAAELNQEKHPEKQPEDCYQPRLSLKLHQPRLPELLVTRERLLARLDRGLHTPLTLLCAPAGFGKTTLAGQWLASRKQTCAVWIRLDSTDNDPQRFWFSLLTACATLQGKSRSSASLDQMLTTQQPLETTLTGVLNELHGQLAEGIILLEEYEVITSARVHETLTFWLEHLPERLRIVILTRSVPPFPLVRWRARGMITEVGATELRFSEEETTQLLSQHFPVALSAATRTHLEKYFEGWPAGLQLALLALQGRNSQQEVEQFLSTLSGNHHHLLEYVVSEVLDTQPEAIQRFLLQTCILSSLTASLCIAVSGEEDSEEMLSQIERRGLFLLRLDGNGRWYRYHALFAQIMQCEAARRLGEDHLRTYSSRASRWYEEQKMFADAIAMAFSAHEFERVATLIEGSPYFQHVSEIEEATVLQYWVDQLPEEVLRRHPILCLVTAMVQTFARTVVRKGCVIERKLQLAAETWKAEDNNHGQSAVLAMQALTACWNGQMLEAFERARRALASLPADEHGWITACLSIRAVEETFQGQFTLAWETLQQACISCEASGNLTSMPSLHLQRADLLADRGELHPAEALYRQVYAEMQEILKIKEQDAFNRMWYRNIGMTHIGLARIYYEWNDLERAEGQAQAALERGRQLEDKAVQVGAIRSLALICQARGQTEQALALLAPFAVRAQLQQPAPFLRHILADQARIHLAVGNFRIIERWVQMAQLKRECIFPIVAEQEDVVMAQFSISQGDASTILLRLEQLYQNAQQQGRYEKALEFLVIRALACSALRQREQALHTVNELLPQAYAGGYTRLFLDKGEPMAALLRLLATQAQEPALQRYLQQLLHAFEQETRRPFSSSTVSEMVDLTTQEQRVFLLLAQGRSNQEIAGRLVVSINTVKTHVHNIYHKLHIHSRWDAKFLARTLHDEMAGDVSS